MERFKYNKFLDDLSFLRCKKENTLIIRIEGNIGEDCPSDMHRYDIALPAVTGDYKADFSAYVHGHVYSVSIKSVDEKAMNIRINGEDFVLNEGDNPLFEEKEYGASYDGPWFTGVNVISAVWSK